MIGEDNIWKFLASRGDQGKVEVVDIEGRGTYHRSRVEGGTELTPPD